MIESFRRYIFFNSKNSQLFIIFIFAIITFFPAFTNGFTNFDDVQQVTENPDIINLSLQNIKNIFSSYYVGMYQPLTTFCFALIYELFSLKAAAFHVFCLLLHFINIFLVFRLANKFTEKKEVGFFVALLFAINPLQTEAVAWVSATSTLLYSLFFLLSANAYVNFVRQNNYRKDYYFSLLFFLLSLLSKSAAVTLPLLLLLFDYFSKSKITRNDLLLKIPFFVLSVVFGIITIIGRQDAGHIVDITKYYDFFDRILFVLTSVAFYITSVFIPFKLSAFHPYPVKTGSLLPFMFYILPFILIVAMVFIVRVKKSRKEIIFGFLFFLFSISVMLEFIPVGIQVVKERYTYLPCIGIYFAALSYLFFLFEKKSSAKKIMKYAVFGLSLLFVVITFFRTQTWKNSFTLWNDVIKKYPKCSAAYINRGNAYVVAENYDKAISDFDNAIRFEATAADAYMNRAIAKSKKNNIAGAIRDYDKAISIGPADDKMYSERAILKLGTEDIEGALADLSSAVKINSSNEKYYNQRGIIYGMTGNFNEAVTDFSKAIELDPGYADAYSNRGLAEMSLLQTETAIHDFTTAIEINASEARTYYLRGLAYEQNKNTDAACTDLKKAYDLGFTAAAEEITKICK